MTVPERPDRAESFLAQRHRVPYADFLDLQYVGNADAEAQFRLPFRPSLIGSVQLAALHGGAVAGFMETAALLHLVLQHGEQRLPKSIDFSIDYLRSAHADDCFAHCEITRLGRRVAQVQIRCWQYQSAGS